MERKKVNWDEYFHTRYKPEEIVWGNKDLQKYKKWYESWIPYVSNKSEILSVKKNRKKVRVLEVGSGIGAISSLLYDKKFTVTGSDISKTMVQRANKVNKNIKFFFCDVEKQIRPARKWDVIIGMEVLEHLNKPSTAIKNILLSLSNGGEFIGTTPFPFRKNFADPTHVNVKSPSEWEKIFKKNGFSSVKTYPISVFPILWKISARLNLLIPFYISWPFVTSTILIVAKK